MPQNLIARVENVAKTYYTATRAIEVLKSCNFELARGDYVALIGPSGSGKTTFLNLIAGLDHPSAGRIEIDGREISAMDESALASWRTTSIGFVFQFYHLIPVLSAYENVELPLLLLRMSSTRRREQVTKALDLVGLSHRSRHRPGQLSGGEQQRVGIARALVTDPMMIVADEPTGDLDARKSEEILDLLQELRDGLHKTIFLVTHDPTAAVRADRVLQIEDGVLVEGGREMLRAAFPMQFAESPD